MLWNLGRLSWSRVAELWADDRFWDPILIHSVLSHTRVKASAIPRRCQLKLWVLSLLRWGREPSESVKRVTGWGSRGGGVTLVWPWEHILDMMPLVFQNLGGVPELALSRTGPPHHICQCGN